MKTQLPIISVISYSNIITDSKLSIFAKVAYFGRELKMSGSR